MKRIALSFLVKFPGRASAYAAFLSVLRSTGGELAFDLRPDDDVVSAWRSGYNQ